MVDNMEPMEEKQTFKDQAAALGINYVSSTWADTNDFVTGLISGITLGSDKTEGAQKQLEVLTHLSDLEEEITLRLEEFAKGAHRDGATWEEIGAALGTSRQGAHKRFGK